MSKKKICFTSFTYSYFAKACVLANSFKKHNPDWIFIAFITDREPERFNKANLNKYFDVHINTENIGIKNYKGWLFKHNIVEACTAVKGPALQYLIKTYSPEKVIYLDPDIAVFDKLSIVEERLDDYDIILTPHQIKYSDDEATIRDNEIGSLKHGVFNLGFFAIACRDEGLKFAKWWENKLLLFCYDDIANGLFTDQKWCNLVPVFFDNVKILKHFGYNVASWNIYNRVIKITESGDIKVNGLPLVFYHFTKLGPIGASMTVKYAKTNFEVYELWAYYKKEVEKYTDKAIPDDWWFYNKFSNGENILPDVRKLYRVRSDLQRKFTNPFINNELNKFYQSEII